MTQSLLRYCNNTVVQVLEEVPPGPGVQAEFHSPLLALLQEAEQFLREAEQEVLNRREKVGGAPQSPARPPRGGGAVPQGGRTGGPQQEKKDGWNSTVPYSPSYRSSFSGRGNRRSSPGDKRWVELLSPLLTLLQEVEPFLREAEQEVLNRREKVGGAPQSPAEPPSGGGAVPQGGGTGGPQQERKGGCSS